MPGLLSRAYHILANEGPLSLLRKGWDFATRPLPTSESVRFYLADRKYPEPHSDTIAVTLRKSTFDSDSLSILLGAEDLSAIQSVFVIADSLEQFNDRHQDIRRKLDELETAISFVEVGTRAVREAVLESHLVFLRNGHDLLEYRQANRNPSRTFVRIFHGFGKAGGPFRHREGDEESSPIQLPARFRNIDYYIVSTDMELFYRSAAKDIHPAKFLKCGYPKYTRLWNLQDGQSEPLVPDHTLESLRADDGQTRVLYAPTHKGVYESTELFPFPNFDIEVLRDHLEALNTVLYIRMHIHEEEAGVYDQIIDGERIKYAGHNFSPSATEILPSFDALITDYSSIYTEYLALDRPILFVIDESNPYWTNKGLAFEEESYMPGPKISSFEHFCEELESNLTDTSRYGDERDFATTAVLPDRNIDFLTCISEKIGH